MKKTTFFGLLTFILLSFQLHAQEKITLSVAHFWPATHFIHVDQFPRYFKMVENATKGKYVLDIKWYPAESLLKATDLFDGIMKGIGDSGTSCFGYNPGRFPVILTLSEPGIAPPANADAAAHIVWEMYKVMKPKELEGVKLLYAFGTGPGWIHSNKPITKIDQLKGMKIRVTGAGVRAVKAVGGEAVAMPMSEVYIAASKGIIEALVSPAETLEGFKHAEVFKYSTFMPHFYCEYFWYAMNLTKWNSLPKDLRDAFEATSEQAVKLAGQIWQFNQKKAEEFAKKQPGGHEFLYLSKEEISKLENLLKSVEKAYIEELNGKGLPGEKIVSEAKQIAEKYNKVKYEPWKP